MNPQTESPRTANVLFLGGPMDGERLDVAVDAWSYVVPEFDEFASDTLFREHRYRRENLGGIGTRIPVYVSESLTLADALRMLVNGYAGKPASEETR